MRKKILVTGGAGYIGSHTVVELANAGYEPVIVDNFCNSDKTVLKKVAHILGRDIKNYEIDCNDRELLREMFRVENDIQGVIHFAAFKAVGESVHKPLAYYHNNIHSLLCLLELLLEFGITDFVFSSSCTVYGQPDQLPVTEDTPRKNAESPYGNTKKISEEILEDMFRAGADLKAVALRYFNPIGAHPTALIGELPIGVPNNLVPFITQTAAGIREKLTIFGQDYNTPDGTCIRDYIHVVDLAKAHVRALQYIGSQEQKTFYDVFNLGTGQGNSVKEVVETFIKATGVELPFVYGDRRPGDIIQIYANADKAANVLGWRTELSLDEALKDAWRWQQTLMK